VQFCSSGHTRLGVRKHWVFEAGFAGFGKSSQELISCFLNNMYIYNLGIGSSAVDLHDSGLRKGRVVFVVALVHF
jgi:hypothetical protein